MFKTITRSLVVEALGIAWMSFGHGTGGGLSDNMGGVTNGEVPTLRRVEVAMRIIITFIGQGLPDGGAFASALRLRRVACTRRR